MHYCTCLPLGRCVIYSSNHGSLREAHSFCLNWKWDKQQTITTWLSIYLRPIVMISEMVKSQHDLWNQWFYYKQAFRCIWACDRSNGRKCQRQNRMFIQTVASSVPFIAEIISHTQVKFTLNTTRNKWSVVTLIHHTLPTFHTSSKHVSFKENPTQFRYRICECHDGQINFTRMRT